ncbi:MAG: metal-dependent hydrolase [Pseudomonadota bacterium]
MKLVWYGHSAFSIESGNAKILIDPFFTGNPKFDESWRADALNGLTNVALTHGHADHLGDTVAIAKETGATVTANADLCGYIGGKGVENLDPANTGGTLHHDGFSITFVQAHHSSAMIDENGVSHDLGHSNGLVFHFEDGKSVLHMGDTDIFSDMALIQELHRPQVGIVPIGDRFTMGGAVAALACQRYFEFETIIPCHYGTFGLIDPDASTFVAALEVETQKKVKVLDPGGDISL